MKPRVVENPTPDKHYDGWKDIAAALGCSVRTAMRLSRLAADDVRRLEVRYDLRDRVWAYHSWVERLTKRTTRTAEQRAAERKAS